MLTINECTCLLIWINNDGGVAPQACGHSDDHRQMVHIGRDSMPLDQLEVCLLRAVGDLQERGWLISTEQVEAARESLRRFWHHLNRFAQDAEEERNRRS